jgi:hypothetical protein
MSEATKSITGQYPTWRHIHNQGWTYVLADFDVAQAIGLGQHLHKLDKSMSPQEHIQHILVTCITHFKRNIASRKFPQAIRDLFWELTVLRDKKAVEDVFAELKRYHIKAVDDLVDFYQKPWVLSSLSPAYTRVPSDIFNKINRTTNAGESAHANSNRMGKKNSLLAAIHK